MTQASLWTYVMILGVDGFVAPDPANTSVTLHSIAEISSGIICGCLPTLPRFFRHYAPKFKTIFKTFSHSFRGQTQTTTIQNSWPKAYESYVSTKLDSAQPDGQYLELRNQARVANL